MLNLFTFLTLVKLLYTLKIYIILTKNIIIRLWIKFKYILEFINAIIYYNT